MVSHQREYQIREKIKLIQFFGSRCNNPFCQIYWNNSIIPLEFAHINPTRSHGMGRGSSKRILDIKRNITDYILLCHKCHDIYDNRMIRVYKSEELLKRNLLSQKKIISSIEKINPTYSKDIRSDIKEYYETEKTIYT
jgi:hypothetical protein